MLPSLSIFCAAVASTFCTIVGEANGPMKIVSLLATYLLAWSVALWVQTDAVQRSATTAYDFDTLIFAFWPLAAPIYLVRTRGWGAMRPIGLFLLLVFGGIVFASVLAYPESVAYFRARQP